MTSLGNLICPKGSDTAVPKFIINSSHCLIERGVRTLGVKLAIKSVLLSFKAPL